jgi:hypothetical protein
MLWRWLPLRGRFVSSVVVANYIGGENWGTRNREPTDLPEDIYKLVHINFYRVYHIIVLSSLISAIIYFHLYYAEISVSLDNYIY